ncbi:unnamed protein product [Amoebophrya sp. A25]|nr:unnamed protein product [Amoebophrya sp. A25]|eukprot:GSA25T00007290001.1
MRVAFIGFIILSAHCLLLGSGISREEERQVIFDWYGDDSIDDDDAEVDGTAFLEVGTSLASGSSQRRATSRRPEMAAKAPGTSLYHGQVVGRRGRPAASSAGQRVKSAYSQLQPPGAARGQQVVAPNTRFAAGGTGRASPTGDNAGKGYYAAAHGGTTAPKIFLVLDKVLPEAELSFICVKPLPASQRPSSLSLWEFGKSDFRLLQFGVTGTKQTRKVDPVADMFEKVTLMLKYDASSSAEEATMIRDNIKADLASRPDEEMNDLRELVDAAIDMIEMTGDRVQEAQMAGTSPSLRKAVQTQSVYSALMELAIEAGRNAAKAAERALRERGPELSTERGSFVNGGQTDIDAANEKLMDVERIGKMILLSRFVWKKGGFSVLEINNEAMKKIIKRIFPTQQQLEAELEQGKIALSAKKKNA